MNKNNSRGSKTEAPEKTSQRGEGELEVQELLVEDGSGGPANGARRRRPRPSTTPAPQRQVRYNTRSNQGMVSGEEEEVQEGWLVEEGSGNTDTANGARRRRPQPSALPPPQQHQRLDRNNNRSNQGVGDRSRDYQYPVTQSHSQFSSSHFQRPPPITNAPPVTASSGLIPQSYSQISGNEFQFGLGFSDYNSQNYQPRPHYYPGRNVPFIMPVPCMYSLPLNTTPQLFPTNHINAPFRNGYPLFYPTNGQNMNAMHSHIDHSYPIPTHNNSYITIAGSFPYGQPNITSSHINNPTNAPTSSTVEIIEIPSDEEDQGQVANNISNEAGKINIEMKISNTNYTVNHTISFNHPPPNISQPVASYASVDNRNSDGRMPVNRSSEGRMTYARNQFRDSMQ